MQIGLFGGTYNPVHIGHLRAALEVKEGFDLEKNAQSTCHVKGGFRSG